MNETDGQVIKGNCFTPKAILISSVISNAIYKSNQYIKAKTSSIAS